LADYLVQIRREGEGEMGDANRASSAAIEPCLKSIHYPASKEEENLLSQVRENHAPQDVTNFWVALRIRSMERPWKWPRESVEQKNNVDGHVN